jgi:hypothetical protein
LFIAISVDWLTGMLVVACGASEAIAFGGSEAIGVSAAADVLRKSVRDGALLIATGAIVLVVPNGRGARELTPG